MSQQIYLIDERRINLQAMLARCLHARSISSVPIADNERSHNYGKRIYKKERQKWYYRFYVEDASGNLVQKEFAGNGEQIRDRECYARLWRIMTQKNFLAKADNLTLGQMLDVWAEEDLKTGSLSNGTVGNYLQAVNRIKQHPIGNRKLKTVTSDICRSLWICLHLAVRKEILSQRVTPSTISVLSTQSCNSPSDLQSFQSSTSHLIQCSMW